MDFMKKYRLALDWFDNALHVFDRKANIKAPWTFVTVSKDSIGSKKVTNEVLGIGTPSQTDPEWVAFQVAYRYLTHPYLSKLILLHNLNPRSDNLDFSPPPTHKPLRH